MNEQEQVISSVEEKKAKIRERYKGVDEDQLSVIPAIPKIDIFDRDRTMRVAVYARVSTDDPNQTSSYELQKNHYTDLINHNPNWHLVDIYADEGISGTSLKHRDNFLRMIKDCEAGLIDLIITKSVSRFARNIMDSIGYIRKLGALNPPIGVFFETENLNTLNSQSEMSIAFLSTMAQEESHNKSEVMNVSVEMRFKRGIFLTPPLLGFDLDEDGNLIINEEEAKTVRLIFFMYLFGYSCQQIAETLTKLKRKTKKGNIRWSASTVLSQLQNERHCGSVLARKTFTPNYLDHKSKKNRLDRNQYFQEKHHEPIVSRADFITVQHMIQNSKNGNHSILPSLKVVPDGSLAGYVSINPRWKGFTPEDYRAASTSIENGSGYKKPEQITVEKGDLDLRGFEIVRAQFIDGLHKLIMSFSPDKISFSMTGVRKLDCEYVEILVHPVKKSFIIRKTGADNRLAFKWARKKGGVLINKGIGAAAIMPCIFSMLGWDKNFRYRIQGTAVTNKDITLLYFKAEDAEKIMPSGTEKVKKVTGYPVAWADNFGEDYYSHQRSPEIVIQQEHLPLIIPVEQETYNPFPDISVPSKEQTGKQIEIIMNEIAPEGQKDE